MFEKLKSFAAWVTGRGQMNIYRRVLRIALAGSLMTFILMGAVSFYALFKIHAVLDNSGEELGNASADYIEGSTESQVKKRLTEVTRMRAQLINRELENVGFDVRFISDEMSARMKHPENYAPLHLPIANEEEVPGNTPYVHYSPELAAQGASREILREIWAASSAADMLKHMNEFYGSVFVGSKHGYTIKIDSVSKSERISPLSKEPLRSEYDPRERIWYRLGENATEPAFTDLYTSTLGEPCVSVSMPYYDAEGFAGVVGLDVNPKDIYDQFATSSQGDTEFSFVLGRSGEVLFSTKADGVFRAGDMKRDLRMSGDRSVADAARRMMAGETGITLVQADGEEYYLAFAPMKSIGWSFGTLIDTDEVTGPTDEARGYIVSRIRAFHFMLNRFFMSLSAGAFALLAILFAALVWLSLREANRFVKPIRALSDGVREIAGGNLDKKIDVRTGDEIETLAESFNQMTDELKSYIDNLAKTTAENERIETELSVAASIQKGMLPGDFPTRREFDLFASMQPAKEVGGDFYDFYFVDENHLVVTVADVSDKGVPAALFMVIAKTLLKDTALVLKSPAKLPEVMARANDQLVKSNDEGMFVTVFMGMLDIRTGEFVYVNAGHNPPLLRQGKEFRYFPMAKGPMIGVMEGMEFPAERLKMEPGDALFLYTDGVTETMNDEQQIFSEERLIETLNHIPRDTDAKETLAAVREAVSAHAGGAEQSDDITMLAFVYHGLEIIDNGR